MNHICPNSFQSSWDIFDCLLWESFFFLAANFVWVPNHDSCMINLSFFWGGGGYFNPQSYTGTWLHFSEPSSLEDSKRTSFKTLVSIFKKQLEWEFYTCIKTKMMLLIFPIRGRKIKEINQLLILCNFKAINSPIVLKVQHQSKDSKEGKFLTLLNWQR